jgi:ribonuclease III
LLLPTKKFVLSFLSREVNNHHTNFKDYKTALQEIVQKNPDETFNYVLVGESGPDHDKRFEVEVHINSNAIAKGVGRSKSNISDAVRTYYGGDALSEC